MRGWFTRGLYPALVALATAISLAGCGTRPGLLPQSAAGATDSAAPPGFTLTVQAPDDARRLLEQHLELRRYQNLTDLDDGELDRLMSMAEADARDLLGTLGHFAPAVSVQRVPAAGHATPPGPPRQVLIRVDPGPRTRVAAVELRADGAVDAQQLRQAWTLPEGEPFTQQGWADAKAALLRHLQTQRHPMARVVDSRADIDAVEHRARLRVRLDPGPAVIFGPLVVRGSQRHDPQAVGRIARLPTGRDYGEADLLDAQQRLASSGYYDSVFLTLDSLPQVTGTAASASVVATVTAQVRDAPLQKLVFGLGVSTDNGPRLSLDHLHNQLPWLGWRATTRLLADRDTREADTEWTALPDESGWRTFTGARLVHEATGSYDTDSLRLRAGRGEDGSPISRNYYLQYDQADSLGAGSPPASAAWSANYSWTGRYFDNALSPARGYGLSWEVGGGSTMRPTRVPYTRVAGRALGFIGLGRQATGDRLGRIALRAEAGAVTARQGAEIPVTQLFLTGGDQTVRGYAYQGIGARLTNGTLYGGRYMALGSVEWQRPLTIERLPPGLEGTVFMDAGAVADHPADLRARVGVGVGVRWRSPVGPIQADLARGIQENRTRLHLRLGFTF